jgi:hypothetical protein
MQNMASLVVSFAVVWCLGGMQSNGQRMEITIPESLLNLA